MSRITAFELNDKFSTMLKYDIEDVCTQAPIHPYLGGEGGIGKSSLVREICEKWGWMFFLYNLGWSDGKDDITGCRTATRIDEKTKEEIFYQIFFPAKPVQDAIQAAKANPDKIVVLFLDEINRGGPTIANAILGFTTDRTIGTYTFPDNIRFISAGNDRGNTYQFDSAATSRFIKYSVKPDVTKWLNVMPDLNPYVKKVVTQHPDLLVCYPNSTVVSTTQGDDGDEYSTEYETFDDTPEDCGQYTCPRTLHGLSVLLNKVPKDTLMEWLQTVSRDPDTGTETSWLENKIYAHIGETAFAAELLTTISNDLLNGVLAKASSVVAPTKPNCYKGIMACKDRQTRDEMIRNLSDDEKSAAIIYAVWEKGVDNKELIQTLASAFSGQVLTGNYQPQFSNLKSHDELDEDNYAALITSGTPLGLMMKSILGD